MKHEECPDTVLEDAAWRLLRACVARTGPAALALRGGEVDEVSSGAADAVLERDAAGHWHAVPDLPAVLSDMLALYLPLCGPSPVTLAHLGQSLDGFVATGSGDSCFVNDAANIVHLHRLRALCDAVVVGGATVRDDDPRLTTRRVSGPNPLRVVIDPRLQLDPASRVFRDGEAETLRVCTVDAAQASQRAGGNGALLRVGRDAQGHPDLAELLSLLRERGCARVFIEGGGVTVSRFLQAGLLDRLQLAVAPLLIGDGRPGIRLPSVASLAQCPRPQHRVFRMGADLLFDLDLRDARRPGPPRASVSAPLLL